MVITIKMGMPESMFRHHTTEELNLMLKKDISERIYKQMLESDYINIQSRFSNGENDEGGVEYCCSFVILNQQESEIYMKQMKELETFRKKSRINK